MVGQYSHLHYLQHLWEDEHIYGPLALSAIYARKHGSLLFLSNHWNAKHYLTSVLFGKVLGSDPMRTEQDVLEQMQCG
jgi:hypothetical protein